MTIMRQTGPWLLIALPALAAHLWLSASFYRAGAEPVASLERRGLLAQIVGPRPSVLTEAAEAEIRDGLAALNNGDQPPGDRIAAYREKLDTARRLLERSLAAGPAQAKALSDYAAVVTELSPPLTDGEIARQMELIEVAASMAPRLPTVRQRLAELLLRMGRDADALRYFAQALELDPTRAREVVGYLRGYLYSAQELAVSLPSTPETLSVLEQPFREDGAIENYLALLDEHDVCAHRELIQAYGESARRIGAFDRVTGRLTACAERTDALAEAERLMQLSQAARGARRPDRAWHLVDRAIALAPGEYRYSVHKGDLALEAGRAEEAVNAYKRALTKAALSGKEPRLRAWLYGRIGDAQEAAGYPDRAYDAYRRALELDAREPRALARVTQMENDAAASR